MKITVLFYRHIFYVHLLWYSSRVKQQVKSYKKIGLNRRSSHETRLPWIRIIILRKSSQLLKYIYIESNVLHIFGHILFSVSKVNKPWKYSVIVPRILIILVLQYNNLCCINLYLRIILLFYVLHKHWIFF